MVLELLVKYRIIYLVTISDIDDAMVKYSSVGYNRLRGIMSPHLGGSAQTERKSRRLRILP